MSCRGKVLTYPGVPSKLPLAATRQEVENLARAVSDGDSLARAAQEKYERLAAEVELLRQADGVHTATAQDLRKETQDLAALVSDRIDALFGRLDLQNGELAALKSALSSNSSSVASVIERLNRQAEAIRHFAQTQESEWGALERLREVLSSLQAIVGQRAPASVDDL